MPYLHPIHVSSVQELEASNSAPNMRLPKMQPKSVSSEITILCLLPSRSTAHLQWLLNYKCCIAFDRNHGLHGYCQCCRIELLYWRNLMYFRIRILHGFSCGRRNDIWVLSSERNWGKSGWVDLKIYWPHLAMLLSIAFTHQQRLNKH